MALKKALQLCRLLLMLQQVAWGFWISQRLSWISDVALGQKGKVNLGCSREIDREEMDR